MCTWNYDVIQFDFQLWIFLLVLCNLISNCYIYCSYPLVKFPVYVDLRFDFQMLTFSVEFTVLNFIFIHMIFDFQCFNFYFPHTIFNCLIHQQEVSQLKIACEHQQKIKNWNSNRMRTSSERKKKSLVNLNRKFNN